MRILFLSNFYPPARPGGYTQWCYEVAGGLQERGHTIGVLTSRHEAHKAAAGERDVYRLLHLEGDLAYYRPRHFFAEWRKQQRENRQFLKQSIDSFRPDLLFVWGMWALSQALPAQAEQRLPGRVVYYLSDYWPMAQDMHTTYWRAAPRHRAMRLPKRVLRFAAEKMLDRERHRPPRFENAICVSHGLKHILMQAGLPLQAARVIHGGTDVQRFREAGERHSHALNDCIKLLYAGQLAEHKGVHTAIEAMALLKEGPQRDMAHLTIMGGGHPDYEARLRRMVADAALQDCVQFREQVSATQIPAVFAEHHVLVFPSIYDEPLARVTQEAMASGMVVVGTTTGGTAEILIDGANGLTFPAGDAAKLARQLQRLMLDPLFGERLAAAGRARVLSYFNLERMIDEIETTLLAVAQSTSSYDEVLQAQRVV